MVQEERLFDTYKYMKTSTSYIVTAIRTDKASNGWWTFKGPRQVGVARSRRGEGSEGRGWRGRLGQTEVRESGWVGEWGMSG